MVTCSAATYVTVRDRAEPSTARETLLIADSARLTIVPMMQLALTHKARFCDLIPGCRLGVLRP